jgi:hypothetical protein
LFATLRIVFKLFILKETLFPCREDELLTAVHTSQNTIGKFHIRLPRRQGNLPKSASTGTFAGPGSLFSFVCTTRARAAISCQKRLQRTHPINSKGRVKASQRLNAKSVECDANLAKKKKRDSLSPFFLYFGSRIHPGANGIMHIAFW